MHPIFSLKKENQTKMYESFRRDDNNPDPIGIFEMDSVVDQDVRDSKNITNVLQALYHKHDQFNAKLQRHSTMMQMREEFS
jgi:hypothetical protein